jgi:hypothetical protein
LTDSLPFCKDYDVKEEGETSPVEPTLTLTSSGRWKAEWATLTVPISSGDLAGWTATVRYQLIDGRMCIARAPDGAAPIEYAPPEPAPVGASTSRALRSVGLGDLQQVVETCLRNAVGQEFAPANKWLDALAATRKRPGRAGTAPALWARIAARRVDAEHQAPGNAIRYMRQTWPDEFTSDAAVWAKVNKAVHHRMLEMTDDGPRLTDAARRLLEGKD